MAGWGGGKGKEKSMLHSLTIQSFVTFLFFPRLLQTDEMKREAKATIPPRATLKCEF